MNKLCNRFNELHTVTALYLTGCCISKKKSGCIHFLSISFTHCDNHSVYLPFSVIPHTCILMQGIRLSNYRIQLSRTEVYAQTIAFRFNRKRGKRTVPQQCQCIFPEIKYTIDDNTMDNEIKHADAEWHIVVFQYEIFYMHEELWLRPA